MQCPSCQVNTKVIETRNYIDPEHQFLFTKRRRKCLSCGMPFDTIEIPVCEWVEYERTVHEGAVVPVAG